MTWNNRKKERFTFKLRTSIVNSTSYFTTSFRLVKTPATFVACIRHICMILYFTATCVLMCFRCGNRNEASRSRRCDVRDNGSLRSRHKVISEQSGLYSSLSAALSSSSSSSSSLHKRFLRRINHHLVTIFCDIYVLYRFFSCVG